MRCANTARSSMRAGISLMENKQKKRAAFFDRDGTLNVDKGYLYRKEDFAWLEDAVDAIRACNEADALVIVVTNQSGVARGYYKEADIRALHDWMNDDLANYGAHIDGFYYCPHLPDGTVEKYAVICDCRKPKPGLIKEACRDFPIDRSRSFLIGDSPRDLECAERAGVKSYRYEGGSLLAMVRHALSEG